MFCRVLDMKFGQVPGLDSKVYIIVLGVWLWAVAQGLGQLPMWI